MGFKNQNLRGLAQTYGLLFFPWYSYYYSGYRTLDRGCGAIIATPDVLWSKFVKKKGSGVAQLPLISSYLKEGICCARFLYRAMRSEFYIYISAFHLQFFDYNCYCFRSMECSGIVADKFCIRLDYNDTLSNELVICFENYIA